MKLAKIILCIIMSLPLCAAQDDLALILVAPSKHVAQSGFGVFNNAHSEIDLGYYLLADEYHRWRARVLGDISLINFSSSLQWHMGLGMEALADTQNDINFRLVQVYYQVLTGIKWHFGSSMVHFGYRHRCSHGTDRATESRITIKSGITASYVHGWDTKYFRFDIQPGVNIYVLGQNSDVSSHPRGGSFLIGQAIWPFLEHLSLVFGSGLNVEVVSRGEKDLYFGWNKSDNWHAEPLFSARTALRYETEILTSDFALAFRQNLDSSIGPRAIKNNNLLLEINFLW